MGRIADALDQMVVQATSPDGQMGARLSCRDRLELRFRPGGYDRYTEDSITDQLSTLATTVWASYQRAHVEIMTRYGVTVVGAPGDVWEANEREFVRERNAVVGDAWSANWKINAITTGLRRWEFRIRPGTVSKLTQQEFIDELFDAVQAARTKYEDQVAALKERYFTAEVANPGAARRD